MVVIKRWGREVIAVSETRETAIQALYEKYASEWDKKHYDSMAWWESGVQWNSGVPHCYTIEPIEKI